MSNIDQTIQTLFTKVGERKKKVAALETEVAKSWKTNCTFRLIGAVSPTNITTASVEVVEEIATHIVMIERARVAAGAELDRQLSTKIQGYEFSDWFADLNKRFAMINIREEKKQLEDLEKRLNSVLSPEERRRLEVEALARDIG